MRLLKFNNRGDLTLTKNLYENIPRYAILSHTWGADDEEVTFKDLENGSGKIKAGYDKILFCGEQAKRDNLQHFWVDTCCIDKASHTELSEAIASMFRWYRDSVKCYVYLSDVPIRNEGNEQTKQTWKSVLETPVHDDDNKKTGQTWESAFRASRWFTRGWTLQELIAPRSVEFFSWKRKCLGNKNTLEQQIHRITEIPVEALRGSPLSEFSVHERMRWAENRKTLKKEDKAYCLLGIFNVFMPLIYGEEENAFVRLEAEIDRSFGKLLSPSENKINLAKDDEAIKKSLNDLQATDPELDMERIEYSKDPLLKDCYEWILNEPILQEWRDGDTSPLLWIKGDPGKGKTMLMIALVRELTKTPPQSSRIVAFFFCQNTDPRLNTAVSILRGLIWRLAMESAQLANIFHNMYQSKSNQLNGPNAIYALFSTLLAMLDGCPGAFILIDALDECSAGTEREQLLGLIVKHTKSSKTKWLLSSRNDADIKQELMHEGQMLSLELNEQHISNAVYAFIEQKTSELAKKNKYSSELEQKVKKELFAKSDSTFLWVALACKSLLKVPSWRAFSTLHEFPVGLQGLYTRMMNQVFRIKDKEVQHFCLGVLRLVTLAFRPLSMEELIAGVKLPPELQAGDLSNLIELCGSFIAIRNEIIYFIHQSAKDYLATDSVQGLFPAGLQGEHGLVVRHSLDAMSKALRKDICNLRHPGAPARSTPTNARLTAVNYICSFWVAHLIQYLGDKSIDGLVYQEYFLDQGRVHKFLLKHLLHWFEALSVIGEIDKGIMGLYSLEEKLAKSASKSILQHKKFVHDAIRVFRQCRTAIEEAPLQVYCSALIFSPEESVIRQSFKREILQWISPLPRIHNYWNPCLQTLEGHEAWVRSVAFSPDGRQLASGSGDCTVRLWDAGTGKCLQTLEGHEAWVESVAFSPDRRQLASGSNDRTVRLWDAGTGKCLQTLEGHEASVRSVAFSPDGRQLASGSGDCTVRLWDAGTGKCLQTLEGHEAWVQSVAFSPDGRQLASGSGDRTVRLWDAGTGKRLQALEGHEASVRSVAFSPDRRQLASGSNDRTVRLWDAGTGKCLQTLEGHEAWVQSVAFSPDGRQLASGSGDCTVRLWDAGTGKCLQTLEGHEAWVQSVAFSPDGRQLASGSGDCTVQLWDAGTGKCLQALEGHTYSVSFSPDGSNLVTDFGTVDVRQILQSGYNQWTGCGIASRKTWITWDGNNLLWLPPEYRPVRSALKGNCVGIACGSNLVYILRFCTDILCFD